MTEETCEHINSAEINVDIEPKADKCQDHDDSSIVQNNVCLTCGYVGCCDSSKGTHATQHFKDTGHAIVGRLPKPFPWMWCYVDAKYVKKE